MFVNAASLKPLIRLVLCAATLGLSACGTTSLESMRNPVPEPLVVEAGVPGYTQIRFWGDNAEGLSPEAIQLRLRQLQEASKSDPTVSARNLHFLTVSGGGSNGAYGAGSLVGWTKSGKRPHFDLVTGISTGSLIAPFAFLGSVL